MSSVGTQDWSDFQKNTPNTLLAVFLLAALVYLTISLAIGRFNGLQKVPQAKIQNLEMRGLSQIL